MSRLGERIEHDIKISLLKSARCLKVERVCHESYERRLEGTRRPECAPLRSRRRCGLVLLTESTCTVIVQSVRICYEIFIAHPILSSDSTTRIQRTHSYGLISRNHCRESFDYSYQSSSMSVVEYPSCHSLFHESLSQRHRDTREVIQVAKAIDVER